MNLLIRFGCEMKVWEKLKLSAGWFGFKTLYTKID